MVNFVKSKIADRKVKLILSFAIIYFVWGTSYMGIRMAIESIPPFLMAGSRFMIAGLLLLTWCFWKFDKKPKLSDWGKAAIPGILMFAGGNGSVTWSEQFIPSGLAALIVATMPVWLIILDWIFASGKRPDILTTVGILLGLTGVAFLFGLDNTVLINDTGYTVVTGIIILTIAAISWAGGSLLARGAKTSVSLPFTISMQILSGGIVLMLLGLIQGEWNQFSISNISLLSIISIGYLILFATLIAYSAYLWLLKNTSPAKVGTYAFFNPLVAVFVGWLFLNEPITSETLTGAGFILVSILLVNRPKFDSKTGHKISEKKAQLKEVA